MRGSQRHKEWKGTDIRIDYADMELPKIEDRDDPHNVMMEGGTAAIGELGVAYGVGLPELALEQAIEIEDIEEREQLYNPSDLQDVGDPEGTDVGVPFGLAAGGEMGEGGREYDGNRNDPWGSALNPRPDAADLVGMGGKGGIESGFAFIERFSKG